MAERPQYAADGSGTKRRAGRGTRGAILSENALALIGGSVNARTTQELLHKEAVAGALYR